LLEHAIVNEKASSNPVNDNADQDAEGKTNDTKMEENQNEKRVETTCGNGSPRRVRRITTQLCEGRVDEKSLPVGKPPQGY
jgi:hypothetical protein